MKTPTQRGRFTGRNILSGLFHGVGAAGVALMAISGQAFAALPTSEAPTRGEGSSLVVTLQNYGFDVFTLIGLILAAVAFIGVAYHALSTYGAIHTGKKTWGDFGITCAVGAMLLVIIVWLLTKSSTIL